jgi:hypothetical protein
MTFVEAIKKLIFFVSLIQKYLIFWKRKQIIDSKNDSIRKGDQRDFENTISSNSDVRDDHVLSDKYSGMYERPVKKKS